MVGKTSAPDSTERVMIGAKLLASFLLESAFAIDSDRCDYLHAAFRQSPLVLDCWPALAGGTPQLQSQYDLLLKWRWRTKSIQSIPV